MDTQAPTVSYYRETAPGKVDRLKERAMVRLGEVFRKKGSTQAETARALGISQPRLSDALRGKYQKFTLDRLYEMLFAFGETVIVEFGTLPAETGGSYVAREPEECRKVVAHYTAAIEEEPGDPLAHGRRAWAYLELDEYEKAIADYTRAIELEPDRSGHYTNRILCHMKAKSFKTALFECDRVEDRFPDCGISQNKSLIYKRLERWDEALECCHQAVLDSPERPGPYYNRAVLYRELGRLAESLEDFREALRCDPKNSSYVGAIKELREEVAQQ